MSAIDLEFRAWRTLFRVDDASACAALWDADTCNPRVYAALAAATAATSAAAATAASAVAASMSEAEFGMHSSGWNGLVYSQSSSSSSFSTRQASLRAAAAAASVAASSSSAFAPIVLARSTLCAPPFPNLECTARAALFDAWVDEKRYERGTAALMLMRARNGNSSGGGSGSSVVVKSENDSAIRSPASMSSSSSSSSSEPPSSRIDSASDSMLVKSERGGLRLRVSFGNSSKAFSSPFAAAATAMNGKQTAENAEQIEQTHSIDAAEDDVNPMTIDSVLPPSSTSLSSSAASLPSAAHSPHAAPESRADVRLIGPTTLRVRLSPNVARTVRSFRVQADGLCPASVSSSSSSTGPLADASVIIPIALRSSPLAASVALQLARLDLALISDAPVFMRVRRLPRRPLAWAVLAGPATSRADLDSAAECNTPLFDLCSQHSGAFADEAINRGELNSDSDVADAGVDLCDDDEGDNEDDDEDDDDEDSKVPQRKRRRTNTKTYAVESDEDDQEAVWLPKRGAKKKTKAKSNHRISRMRRSRISDDDEEEEESEESFDDEEESDDVSDADDDDERPTGRDKKRKRRAADSSSSDSEEE